MSADQPNTRSRTLALPSRLQQYPTLLGAVALCLLLAYAVIPTSQLSSLITVDSASGTTPLLLNEAPEQLRLTFTGQVSGEISTSNRGSGLRVELQDAVRVSVADSVLIDVPTPEGDWSVTLTDGMWSLVTPDLGIVSQVPGPAPMIDMLHVELDSAATDPVGFEIVTAAHGQSPRIWHWLFGIAGLAAALLAGHAATHGPTSPIKRPGKRFDRGDVIVIGGLLVWLVLGPSFFDDGWALTRQRAYSDVGRFSGFFTGAGETVALGYWSDWLFHWWTTAFSGVAILRLPVAALGFATWRVARTTLARLDVMSEARHGNVLPASLFLVGYTAWLQTFRPEPITALLTGLTLLFTVTFRQAGSTRHLWLAAVTALLAVGTHPAGIVAMAPLIATAPQAWESLGADGAERLRRAFTGGAGAVVIIGLVGLLDSDLWSRASEVTTVQTSGSHPFTWRDEIERYRFFGGFLWGTPLRRLFVAVIVATAASFLSRSREEPSAARWLPGRALLLGVFLLLFTPSKWPWHLGGLTVLLVTAAVLEFAARQQRRDLTWGQAGVVAALTAFGIAWAWSVSDSWAHLDLTTLEWEAGATNVFPFSLGGPVVWLVSIAGLALVMRWIGTGQQRVLASSRVIVILSALSTVAFTAGTYARDAAATPGWTLSGQIIDELAGEGTCGMADHITVPSPGTMRPLDLSHEQPDPIAGFEPNGLYEMAPPPLPSISGYGWLPPNLTNVSGTSPVATFRSPWYVFEEEDAVSLLVLGDQHRNAQLAIEWGTFDSGGLDRAGLDSVSVIGEVGWRELRLEPPTGASALRLLGNNAIANAGGWIAVSQPVSFERVSLSSLLEDDDSPSLVSPELVLYTPCVEQPSLAHGVAEFPDLAVLLVPFQTTWLDTFAAAPTVEPYFTVDHELRDRVIVQMRHGLSTNSVPDFAPSIVRGSYLP